ncbi:DUF4192 family protein [Allosaccharopolyspora coralli]|uniref:DUF4192 family protein n=1 Tax=Allosaccharopolyspora coralli TaxID=2665642 RepID=A0A5Q3Q4B6_9PSEU|nr:DUF4192 domain-containing protein [Allosaccharopolyspora coralli]QGK69461.1 DUF4192 family protein [Allosaccharopolyspora coralli]
MTTSLRTTTVSLSEPSETLAAVPYLLGFCPSESLVLLSVGSADARPKLELTVRLDLPEHGAYRALLDYIVRGPVLQRRTEGLVVVVVGGTGASPPAGRGTVEVELDDAPDVWAESAPETPDLPHQDFVEELQRSLTMRGIEVLHGLWTEEIRAGEPWECYRDADCHGTIPDPKASALAATLAAAGTVTYSSREELQALLTPENGDLLSERAARLDLLHEERELNAVDVHSDLATVFGAIRRTAEASALTEDDHVRVLCALADTRVRDVVLGTTLETTARAAEELWITLLRKAPEPELADVAALLAFSAYVRGDGALAGVALERIEATRPEHALGQLLRQALDAALPPVELAAVAREASADARVLIDEEGSW